MSFPNPHHDFGPYIWFKDSSDQNFAYFLKEEKLNF